MLSELDALRQLGVRQVFIEDDSLFGYRRRAVDLLRKIRGQGFDVLDDRRYEEHDGPGRAHRGLRARAWRDVNDQEWVKYKLGMNVSV